MIQIAKRFTHRGFDYTQTERTDNIAIYRQQRHGSHIERFEVVIIRSMPDHTWPAGNTTPEHEYYPTASERGRIAWTFHDFLSAK